MKRLLFPFLMLIFVQLACSFPTVSTAGQPTSAVDVPAPVPPPGNTGIPNELTGTTWTWIGFTSPSEQVAVDSPASYAVTFQQDGTVNITADCNQGQGSYQVNGQSLQIQVGSITKAACPPGSFSDKFIQYLGSAALYSLKEGSLYVDLIADGGTLVFAPSGAAMAASPDLQQALQANPWQWTAFASPTGQYDVETPGSYLLTFHENGTVDIQSDCNTASGTYSLDAIRISITIGPTTLAACPAGSRSEEFLKDLRNVVIYFYQPGELFLTLAADGGTMRFTPVVNGQ
jgi:heat shock protein HslJ